MPKSIPPPQRSSSATNPYPDGSSRGEKGAPKLRTSSRRREARAAQEPTRRSRRLMGQTPSTSPVPLLNHPTHQPATSAVDTAPTVDLSTPQGSAASTPCATLEHDSNVTGPATNHPVPPSTPSSSTRRGSVIASHLPPISPALSGSSFYVDAKGAVNETECVQESVEDEYDVVTLTPGCTTRSRSATTPPPLTMSTRSGAPSPSGPSTARRILPGEGRLLDTSVDRSPTPGRSAARSPVYRRLGTPFPFPLPESAPLSPPSSHAASASSAHHTRRPLQRENAFNDGRPFGNGGTALPPPAYPPPAGDAVVLSSLPTPDYRSRSVVGSEVERIYDEPFEEHHQPDGRTALRTERSPPPPWSPPRPDTSEIGRYRPLSALTARLSSILGDAHRQSGDPPPPSVRFPPGSQPTLCTVPVTATAEDATRPQHVMRDQCQILRRELPPIMAAITALPGSSSPDNGDVLPGYVASTEESGSGSSSQEQGETAGGSELSDVDMDGVALAADTGDRAFAFAYLLWSEARERGEDVGEKFSWDGEEIEVDRLPENLLRTDGSIAPERLEGISNALALVVSEGAERREQEEWEGCGVERVLKPRSCRVHGGHASGLPLGVGIVPPPPYLDPPPPPQQPVQLPRRAPEARRDSLFRGALAGGAASAYPTPPRDNPIALRPESDSGEEEMMSESEKRRREMVRLGKRKAVFVDSDTEDGDVGSDSSSSRSRSSSPPSDYRGITPPMYTRTAVGHAKRRRIVSRTPDSTTGASAVTKTTTTSTLSVADHARAYTRLVEEFVTNLRVRLRGPRNPTSCESDAMHAPAGWRTFKSLVEIEELVCAKGSYLEAWKALAWELKVAEEEGVLEVCRDVRQILPELEVMVGGAVGTQCGPFDAAVVRPQGEQGGCELVGAVSNVVPAAFESHAASARASVMMNAVDEPPIDRNAFSLVKTLKNVLAKLGLPWRNRNTASRALRGSTSWCGTSWIHSHCVSAVVDLGRDTDRVGNIDADTVDFGDGGDCGEPEGAVCSMDCVLGV